MLSGEPQTRGRGSPQATVRSSVWEGTLAGLGREGVPEPVSCSSCCGQRADRQGQRTGPWGWGGLYRSVDLVWLSRGNAGGWSHLGRPAGQFLGAGWMPRAWEWRSGMLAGQRRGGHRAGRRACSTGGWALSAEWGRSLGKKLKPRALAWLFEVKWAAVWRRGRRWIFEATWKAR